MKIFEIGRCRHPFGWKPFRRIDTHVAQMSIELLAVLPTAGLQSILILIGLVMLYRMSNKQTADDAALYLQGHRIEEVMREMRESL